MPRLMTRRRVTQAFFEAAGAGSLETSERLVRSAQAKDAGSADAFARLIAQYERTALALAYSVTGNATVAADVVQDAFIRAWQKIGDLKEPERFGGWLCRIVRNFASDAIRRGPKPTSSLDESLGVASGGHEPNRAMQDREMCDRINAALTTLDDLTRSAVMLRYYEDLSSKEIGDLLDLSPAAVDMRLSRARTQLRSTLAWMAAENGLMNHDAR